MCFEGPVNFKFHPSDLIYLVFVCIGFVLYIKLLELLSTLCEKCEEYTSNVKTNDNEELDIV